MVPNRSNRRASIHAGNQRVASDDNSDIEITWYGMQAFPLEVMVLNTNVVGRRTTASPFDTFRSQLLAPSTYITFAWYSISALLFAEIYVWAQPMDSKLSVIKYSRARTSYSNGSTGARLNERAIAFRSLFVMLGVIQSLIHLFSDRDRVPTPIRKVTLDAKAGPAITVVDPPLTLIRQAAPGIVTRLVWTAAVSPVTAFILYFFTPVRAIAWNVSFDVLRWVYFLPPEQRDIYTGFAPILPFYVAALTQTTLLLLLWEITNAAFSAYIAQPPLRRDQPLTSDTKNGKATDPNGSLISGLKSKKEFAQASAFHELLLITHSFPERRQTIFADLDRAGGNAWTQISTLCLAQIEGINTRINTLKPLPAVAAPEVKGRQPIAPPLKKDDVFAPSLPMGTPARTGQWAKSIVAQYAYSPGSEPAKDVVQYAGRKLLTEGTRERLAQQPAEMEKRVEGLWGTLIKSAFGWPFRRSFERHVVGVVCGTPNSKAGVIVDAIDSLAKLIVESLKEDTYGQVNPSVLDILRTYLSTLKSVQTYVQEVTPHWSDVTFANEKRKSVEEVNEVAKALRDGLAGILGAYGEYLAGLGMGDGEIREIKSVVAEGERRKTPAAPAASIRNEPTAQRQERPRRRAAPEMEEVKA